MGFCPPDKCRCSTDRDTSTHGLIGTPDDACPKYVTLEEDGGKSMPRATAVDAPDSSSLQMVAAALKALVYQDLYQTATALYRTLFWAEYSPYVRQRVRSLSRK